MKTLQTAEQHWITGVLLFVIVLLLTAFSYPKEVRLLPFVVGFPTLVLLVALKLGSFYPGILRWLGHIMGEEQTKGEGPDQRNKSSEFTDWKPVLNIMAWVILFFVFVFVFGFALVSPVFITCFLIRKAGMGWLKAALYAVVAVVLIYLCMEGLIHVDLWSGAVPTVIPGILGGSIIPPL